jgi:hypothetical protein
LGDNDSFWEAAMAVTETSPATAVERALNILEAAAQRREGLTNAEISRKLGIPKSSASYILRALEKRSYLRRETETGRYRLGLKILSLGGDAQTNLDIAHLALPFMRSLVDRIFQGEYVGGAADVLALDQRGEMPAGLAAEA